MRFYAGSHEYLSKVSQLDVFDQCLYLVPELDNKYDNNAVMLHNGNKKLGSVEAGSAARIKRLIQRWKEENGGTTRDEDVVVVKCDRLRISAHSFELAGSIEVRGMYRVNERLARKFSNKHRKD